MVSVGIDVSKDKHDCFIVSSEGEVLAGVFTVPNNMDGFHCLLQKIRDHFGKSVTITSAYRTAAHNKAVKGATYSQHCYGKAADIRVQGVGVEAVAAYAETLLPNRGGVGRYPVKAGRAKGWVHVDTRPNKSRWTL